MSSKLTLYGQLRILAMKQNKNSVIERSSLTKFAWLSIAAAILTIGMKAVAYVLTGSVGLLSDAVESIVNLMGEIGRAHV